MNLGELLEMKRFLGLRANCLPTVHCPLPRRGATLVEVLVAIFVMALGMLSILTLFPLGALQMAQAIKDDRCAHAALNADALANAWNLRGQSFASYPVYVDPIGLDATGSFHTKVGLKSDPTIITRERPSFISGGQGYKNFAILDDMFFDPNTGFPKIPLQRDARYSFAYLLRRPSSDTTVTDLSVVVYNQRVLTTSNILPSLPETTHRGVSYNSSDNTMTFPLGVIPAVRVGEWVLDATTSQPYFYRVVGTSKDTFGKIVLEVQQPLSRGYSGVFPNGIVAVLEGVAEVFEMGTGPMIP